MRGRRRRPGTRMFVAVTPPEEVVQHLDAYLEPRREHATFRFTPPEQFHVTIAFYAAVPEASLDDLTEGLARAAGRRTAFTTRVAGGGAFPDPVQARVLYARLDLGPDAEAELDLLATGARAAAGRAGVAVDGQRFRPHLTVARLARPEEATRWLRVLDAYRGPEWTVEDVSLVASYLGEGPRGRPRYETLAELPLGK
jgi:2'-5' RNA ligase